MKIFSWNIQGLGNPRAFQALKKILLLHGAQIVYLCETKVSVLQMNEIANKLNFDNCFAVNCSGRGGGLALLWNSGTWVQIKSFSKHHIDAEILTTSGRQMRITGVYGHPEIGQKKHTWTLLRWLTGLSFSPWLCFGDFNEVLYLDEKRGAMLGT